mmetsp:Transcript_26396/g.83612  ORF Transcript_26396/g.83612 Transcript_26396/m.83612 type:complete len:246 (+) Transcript_26396:1856-2593(+)
MRQGLVEIGAPDGVCTWPPIDLLHHATLEIECRAGRGLLGLHVEGHRHMRTVRHVHLAVVDAAHEHPAPAELRAHVAVPEVGHEPRLHARRPCGVDELPCLPALLPLWWHLWMLPSLLGSRRERSHGSISAVGPDDAEEITTGHEYDASNHQQDGRQTPSGKPAFSTVRAANLLRWSVKQEAVALHPNLASYLIAVVRVPPTTWGWLAASKGARGPGLRHGGRAWGRWPRKLPGERGRKAAGQGA